MGAAKVVVTGGAGFIGSALVEHLVQGKLARRVLVVDDLSTGRLENLKDVAGDVEVRRSDILDYDAMVKCCRGAEIIFHLAAVASVEQSLRNPGRSRQVNVFGTESVLRAARASGVERFVFASSSAVYGDPASLPTPETEEPRPLSPYGEQKLEAESMIRKLTQNGGPVPVCLRFFNIYGPRQSATSSCSAVLLAFCRAALRREAPVIFGDGRQTRDFIFVDDVVRAIALMATTCERLETLYNVGTSHEYSLNTAWELMQCLAGVELPARFLPPREGDIFRSRADTTMIQGLGFRPNTDLTSGLRRLISWQRLQRPN
jgi:UDP-glucose 4-epimerase